jgi:hypothetical protein
MQISVDIDFNFLYGNRQTGDRFTSTKTHKSKREGGKAL